MALTDKLTAIANAIRAKTGKNDTMTLEQMPTEIASITGGGGEGTKPFDCHSVTFMYGNTVLWVRSVADGDTCADPVDRNLISAPTKESDAQYNYTFYGWGASDGGAADANILKNITEDKTVYAIFSKTLRTYTITYYDDDGVTVLKTETLAYGSMPSYKPTKTGVAFAKWSPTPVAVTGDASYTATWTEVIMCGDNVYAVFEEDTGTLTISGSGDMSYISGYNNVPWYSYRQSIKSIVIEDGITSIFNYAFYQTGITSITIPNSVTQIGTTVFESCANLASIDIPASVTTIGSSVFKDCTALETATLPNSVTEINNFLFKNCTSLKSVIMPANATTFGMEVFNKCKSLENVSIPAGVATIGSQAFIDCSALTSITIPSSVTRIGSYAFLRCSKLTTAIFENTSGWKNNNKSLTVTDPATAAKYLRETYANYYDWIRS